MQKIALIFTSHKLESCSLGGKLHRSVWVSTRRGGEFAHGGLQICMHICTRFCTIVHEFFLFLRKVIVSFTI